MKKDKHKINFFRLVIGYFFIAFSALTLLSVISFSPYDSPLLVSKINSPIQNIAGDLGAWISTVLILVYGQFAAFIIDFGFLVLGVNILISAKIGRLLLKASLFIIASISLSVVLALILPNPTYIEVGMIGLGMVVAVSQIIHPYALIGIFGLMFLLALAGSMKLFRILAFILARTVGQILVLPLRLFGVIQSDKQEQAIDFEDTLSFHQQSSANKGSSDSRSSIASSSFPLHSSFTASEPEFLKVKPPSSIKNNSIGQNSSFAHMNSIQQPVWLKDESQKNSLLNTVRNRFDKVIFDDENTKTNISEQTATESQPSNKMNNSAFTEQLNTNTSPPKEETLQQNIVEQTNNQDIQERKSHKTASLKELYEDEVQPYIFPETNILDQNFEQVSPEEEMEEVKRTIEIIESTFQSFKIQIEVSGYSRGPSITRYEIVPPIGLKLKSILGHQDDLALNLGTRNIRIVAPIGKRRLIGVEVPNRKRRKVVLRSIIESDEFQQDDSLLPMVLGVDITGNVIIEDITEMPHLLIAGTTGSGKSVYVHSLIAGLLFKRKHNELRFIMIDPKMVELDRYNGIPHLLAPVITQPEQALMALEWAVEEMEQRYQLMSDINVRYITDYNQEIRRINRQRKKDGEELLEEFSFIVIIIDEFADLMLRSPKETEKLISRIAAMARAVGIHLVIATQRPSVDVVTGLIKANFPSRIAFRVSSQTDSRTILDRNGAERLLGQGDMLFMTPAFTDIFRIQAPYVSVNDMENIANELRRHGIADYLIDFEQMVAQSDKQEDSLLEVDYKEDPIFPEALKVAVDNGEISASLIQRKFRVGYNRASRIIEAFDRMGILAPSSSVGKPRKVIISRENLAEYI